MPHAENYSLLADSTNDSTPPLYSRSRGGLQVLPRHLIVLGVLLLAGCLIFSEPYRSRLTVRSPASWLVPTFGDGVNGHEKDCDSKRFKKETLKLLLEKPFGGIFLRDSLKKYEASAVAMRPGHSEVFVAFDNLYSIARLGHHMLHDTNSSSKHKHPHSHMFAKMLKWSGDHREDSQFEFLTYNNHGGHYIVGKELAVSQDGEYRSQTYDVTFGDDDVVVGQMCESEHTFSHDNKGFEGAVVVEPDEGEPLLLGLCEGNYCAGGSRGRDAGNGRIVVMKRVIEKDECTWRTVEVVSLPSEVDFADYSDMAIWEKDRIAITSQENSAVYVGKLSLKGGVNISGGSVYDFPRNDNCEVKYCNIEGVAFVDAKRIVTVSDSMKGKGKQHSRCREKDESVHLFQIP